MRINWIEAMVKEGSMSEAARDLIYSDCHEIIKQADAAGAAANVATNPSGMTQAVHGLIGLGIVGLGTAGFSAGKGALDRSKQSNQMVQNREEIARAFGDNVEKAKARFDEIAELAPNVAANKSLVARMVEAKLHSGLTDQDAVNLTMLQNQTTNPAASDKQRRHYQMKTAAVGELYADIFQIMKTAGVEFEKTAGRDPIALGEGLKRMLPVLAVPLGIGAGSGLFSHYMGKKNKEEVEKNLQRSYAQAMKLSDPDREPLHANKQEAQKAFKTLAHFAPHVASEPSAARAFMNKMVSYDMGVDISSIKELTDIEKNLSQVSKDPSFLDGFRAGAEGSGLKQIVSGTVGGVVKPTQEAMGEGLMAGTT